MNESFKKIPWKRWLHGDDGEFQRRSLFDFQEKNYGTTKIQSKFYVFLLCNGGWWKNLNFKIKVFYNEIRHELILPFHLYFRNELGKSACEVCNSIIRLKLCKIPTERSSNKKTHFSLPLSHHTRSPFAVWMKIIVVDFCFGFGLFSIFRQWQKYSKYSIMAVFNLSIFNFTAFKTMNEWMKKNKLSLFTGRCSSNLTINDSKRAMIHRWVPSSQIFGIFSYDVENVKDEIKFLRMRCIFAMENCLHCRSTQKTTRKMRKMKRKRVSNVGVSILNICIIKAALLASVI